MVASVEVVYFLSLVFSIFAGSAVSLLKSPEKRKWSCTAVGLLMLLLLCGFQAVHAIATVFANLLILRFATLTTPFLIYFSINLLQPAFYENFSACCPNRRCHIVSLIVTFIYLAFFRSLPAFGFEKASPYANAVQLVLTLRVIGLAFEVFDSRRAARLRQNDSDATKNSTTAENDQTHVMEKHLLQWQHVAPTPVDAVHYYFCFVGLLTGPYYKFKTYDDFSRLQSRIPLKLLPVHFKRIYSIALYVPLFVLISSFFKSSCLADEQFFAETTVAWRLLYIGVCFFLMRLRFYTAWVLAEAACVASGLGAYPAESRTRPGAGPTIYTPKLKSFLTDKRALQVGECNFETVHNIDEYNCEFADSVRSVLRAWNMTVQYWLYNVVHKRIPNKPLGVCLTLLASAYWHGLHGGYYLGLLSTTVFILGEVYAHKAFKSRSADDDRVHKKSKSWFELCNWWYRVRAFEYMSAGFLLIATARTLQYWQSVYFVGHFIAIGVFLVSFVKFKFFCSQRRSKVE